MNDKELIFIVDQLIANTDNAYAFVMLNCIAGTLLMPEEDQLELVTIMEEFSRKKLEKLLSTKKWKANKKVS